MAELSPKVPIQNGHIAEAIASYAVGPAVRWVGGRNPGYDLELDGIKIDVKSGVRKRRVLSPGADPVDCIGIHLNKGVDGLRDQNVDEFVIVVRDSYSNSSSEILVDGGNVHVELSVDVNNVAVYRVPAAEVRDLFVQPYKRDGSQHVSKQNLEAPVEALKRYLVPLS